MLYERQLLDVGCFATRSSILGSSINGVGYLATENIHLHGKALLTDDLAKKAEGPSFAANFTAGALEAKLGRSILNYVCLKHRCLAFCIAFEWDIRYRASQNNAGLRLGLVFILEILLLQLARIWLTLFSIFENDHLDWMRGATLLS